MIGICAVPLGLIAIFTSVMIYQDTGRISWLLYLTNSHFFGTVASFRMLGILISHPAPIPALSFSFIAILKQVPESLVLRRAGNEDTTWSPDGQRKSPAWTSPLRAFSLLLLGEIAERQLFFSRFTRQKCLATLPE